jgi:thiamine pyrophosphate-dependent acetolactate synthase large subunit-like protein
MVLMVAESPATKDVTAKGDLDQRALAGIIGAGFHHAATPAQLEAAFLSAMRDARWNGSPQVLSLGDGLLQAEVDLTGLELDKISPEFELDPASVRAAVDALERAERPLVLAGQGAVLADCRKELEQFADLIGARVANSLYATSFFSGHPHDLGLCGTWSASIAQSYYAATDVVVAFGASLNRYTTASGTIFGNAQIIHCEIDPDQPLRATTPDLALLGDAGETVQALMDEWRRRGLGERPALGSAPRIEDIRRSIRDADIGHDPRRGVDPRQVYAELDQRLPQDRVVVTDSGRHLKTIPSMVSARDARSFVISRGYGSVGMGIGSAIGAASALPDRRVVLFCGDGGFTMASQDLDSIRYNELDVTIVVINDEMYGAEVKYLRSYGLSTDVLRMSFPDVTALADAYGGRGVVIRDIDELGEVDLEPRGLLLIDVRIDPIADASDAVG